MIEHIVEPVGEPGDIGYLACPFCDYRREVKLTEWGTPENWGVRVSPGAPDAKHSYALGGFSCKGGGLSFD